MSAPQASIDVRQQVRLSLAKVVRIVISGIRHRLFRSTLTMLVILLAVAFFMSMLTESVFVKATGVAVQREVDLLKQPARQLVRLLQPRSALVFRADLANADAQDVKTIATVTGEPEEAIQQLCDASKRVATYLSFFEKLDVGQRFALIGKTRELDIFPSLQATEKWNAFLTALEPMHSVKIPGSEDEFRGFLDRFDAYLTNLERAHLAWNRAVDGTVTKITALTGSDHPTWLREASDEELGQLVAITSAAGFDLDLSNLQGIRHYLMELEIKNNITSRLNSPEGRKAWAAIFRAKHRIDQKLELLTDPRTMEVLTDFQREDVLRIHASLQHEKHMASLSDSLAGKTELSEEGLLSRRQIFLLVISLVVCMVGIANAMLMSITERFREIATMKCLGATDGFILQQFLIEAGIQGLAGGVLGMVIGLLLSFAKNTLIYGSFMLSNLDFGGIAMAGVISLVSGVLLSMLASLYPSWSASRMAPMEAMRVE